MSNINVIKSNIQAGLNSTKSGLKNLYLAIPKDYDPQKGGTLNDFIKAADELGIARLAEEPNHTETAKKIC